MRLYNRTKWKGSEMQLQLAKESFIDRLNREREAVKQKLEDNSSSGSPNIAQTKSPKSSLLSKGSVLHIRSKDKKRVVKVDSKKGRNHVKNFETRNSRPLSTEEKTVQSLTWEIQTDKSSKNVVKSTTQVIFNGKNTSTKQKTKSITSSYAGGSKKDTTTKLKSPSVSVVSELLQHQLRNIQSKQKLDTNSKIPLVQTVGKTKPVTETVKVASKNSPLPKNDPDKKNTLIQPTTNYHSTSDSSDTDEILSVRIPLVKQRTNFQLTDSLFLSEYATGFVDTGSENESPEKKPHLFKPWSANDSSDEDLLDKIERTGKVPISVLKENASQKQNKKGKNKPSSLSPGRAADGIFGTLLEDEPSKSIDSPSYELAPVNTSTTVPVLINITEESQSKLQNSKRKQTLNPNSKVLSEGTVATSKPTPAATSLNDDVMSVKQTFIKQKNNDSVLSINKVETLPTSSVKESGPSTSSNLSDSDSESLYQEEDILDVYKFVEKPNFYQGDSSSDSEFSDEEEVNINLGHGNKKLKNEVLPQKAESSNPKTHFSNPNVVHQITISTQQVASPSFKTVASRVTEGSYKREGQYSKISTETAPAKSSVQNKKADMNLHCPPKNDHSGKNPPFTDFLVLGEYATGFVDTGSDNESAKNRRHLSKPEYKPRSTNDSSDEDLLDKIERTGKVPITLLKKNTSQKQNKKAIDARGYELTTGATGSAVLLSSFDGNQEKHVLSNKKRLDAMLARQKQTVSQKSIIKNALQLVDKKGSGHIVFDSGSEDSGEETTIINNKTVPNEMPGRSVSLFNDDDDIEEDTAANQFRIKPQFEGKSGAKLLKLQNHIGNDERFRLDERFVDKNTEREAVLEEGNGQQLELDTTAERNKTMDVLRSVVGTKAALSSRKSKDYLFWDVNTLRYDPTRDDHHKFEIQNERSLLPKDSSVKKKEKKSPKLPAIVAQAELPEVSKDRFYEVNTSLKDIFGKGDKQSFSFLSSNEETDSITLGDGEMEKSSTTSLLNVEKPSVFPWQMEQTYDSSDEDSVQPGDEGHQVAEQPTVNKKETFFFMEGDARIQDGLSTFCRKEDPETLRKHWLESRPGYVEAYRQIRKRVLRKSKTDASLRKKRKL